MQDFLFDLIFLISNTHRDLSSISCKPSVEIGLGGWEYNKINLEQDDFHNVWAVKGGYLLQRAGSRTRGQIRGPETMCAATVGVREREEEKDRGESWEHQH